AKRERRLSSALDPGSHHESTEAAGVVPRAALEPRGDQPVRPSRGIMASAQSDAAPAPFTLVQWLIAAIASIGFFFDSYALLMLPLIVRPSLSELLAVP